MNRLPSGRMSNSRGPAKNSGHPRCIGSGTCVDACPEKNVIGLVNGRAVLLTPSACVGHSECVSACPVNAIQMVFGTPDYGVHVPDVDDDLQTRLPGVYVAGEATGVSLIRNAVRMGRQVAIAVMQSGRRGVSPLNAILNYCYSVAAAEARIAVIEAGCDPGLGVLHLDRQGRASFALDVLEPVRPHVDAYV